MVSASAVVVVVVVVSPASGPAAAAVVVGALPGAAGVPRTACVSGVVVVVVGRELGRGCFS